MVQDPNFWRRFSLAVHQDDLEKSAARPDLKHSYVTHPSSAPLSPTSQTHLSPAFPLSPVASMSVITAPAPCLRREEVWQAEFEAERDEDRDEHKEQRRRETHTITPKRRPSKLQKSPSRASTRPLLRQQSQRQQTIHIHTHTLSDPDSLPARPSSLRRPSFPALRSPSALSLSGRPRTLFKTWTTITANPVRRDSWLASQKKKSKQRTWICWLFWLCLIVLVAGVVVTVLVLKAHRII